MIPKSGMERLRWKIYRKRKKEDNTLSLGCLWYWMCLPAICGRGSVRLCIGNGWLVVNEEMALEGNEEWGCLWHKKIEEYYLPRDGKQRRSLRRKQGKVLRVQGWWRQEKVWNTAIGSKRGWPGKVQGPGWSWKLWSYIIMNCHSSFFPQQRTHKPLYTHWKKQVVGFSSDPRDSSFKKDSTLSHMVPPMLIFS